MSKRIMNELIYLCEDEDISVYYQDTDSIHILKRDLDYLRDLYNIKFNKELIGDNMGQFHSDFPPVKGKESFAIKSIFLGKKAYLDVLSNEEGDKNNHIRMKGIPGNVIEGLAKEKFDGNVEELYESLYDGNILEFDLLKYGPHFKVNKNLTIESYKTFKRTIKF